MPRYFFDVSNGTVELDYVGTVLRDVPEARQEALRFAAALLAEESMRKDLTAEWALIVRDETDGIVLRLDIEA